MLALEPPTGLAPHIEERLSLACRPWQYLQTRSEEQQFHFIRPNTKRAVFPSQAAFKGKSTTGGFSTQVCVGGCTQPGSFWLSRTGK